MERSQASSRNRGLLLFFILPFLIHGSAVAQNALEVRGADTKYRFADWSYTFRNSAVLDLFYVGVPGSNEFNLGGGYVIRLRPSLTAIPLLYAALGKEGGQRGIKVAVLVLWERAGWKANAFFGHFEPFSGSVDRYQVLDTLDFTRVIRGPWEMGISSGFFHTDGTWSPLVGPVLRINDRYGAWSISYRFGPQYEFRVGRVLAKK